MTSVRASASVFGASRNARHARGTLTRARAGHWLAEAASTVFTKPDVADEEIFKARGSPCYHSRHHIMVVIELLRHDLTRGAQGTLSGWSGDVPQRKRVVARLDALRSHVSELKDKAPRE